MTMLRFAKTHGAVLASAALAALALGAAHAAAESRGLSDYSNCGIKLGTSVAQIRAAEPNAIWDRRDDPVLKREMPVAILGRDRNDLPTDQKRMMHIYFADMSDSGVAYRVSCQMILVDDDLARGLGELRAIVGRFGAPVETYDVDRPISFALPQRTGGPGYPIEYYWGGTRADIRANAQKPMLLVQVVGDGMDRDLFNFHFHLIDPRLRP
jgi:hypothetical protein